MLQDQEVAVLTFKYMSFAVSDLLDLVRIDEIVVVETREMHDGLPLVLETQATRKVALRISVTSEP